MEGENLGVWKLAAQPNGDPAKKRSMRDDLNHSYALTRILAKLKSPVRRPIRIKVVKMFKNIHFAPCNRSTAF